MSLNDSHQLANRIVEIAEEHKGENPVLLDMRATSGVTDIFVLLTGQNKQHVQAIADHIVDELRKEGVRPSSREGEQGAKWVCLDLGPVWVHLFTEDLRDYYDLETLWRDAPRLQVASGGESSFHSA